MLVERGGDGNEVEEVRYASTTTMEKPHPRQQESSPAKSTSSFREEFLERSARLVEGWHAGGKRRRRADLMRSLGADVRELKCRMGLKREDLAQMLGVQVDFLHLMEHGLVEPEEIDDAMVARLESLLGFAPGNLRRRLGKIRGGAR